jgi:hypothetical protein
MAKIKNFMERKHMMVLAVSCKQQKWLTCKGPERSAVSGSMVLVQYAAAM